MSYEAKMHLYCRPSTLRLDHACEITANGKDPLASARHFLKPRGLGWRIHCGVEVTELSTNKQHTLLNQAAGHLKPGRSAAKANDIFSVSASSSCSKTMSNIIRGSPL
jgi:hypothetical protein